MRRRALLLLSLGLVGAPVAALAQGGTPADEVKTQPPNTWTKTEVHVTVGQTVTWTNKDPFPHDVSAPRLHLHSPAIAPDETWSFTPREAGRFDYECSLHPGMKGILVVTK